MAPTILDLDAAMIEGAAKAQEWEAEFQQQFYAPMLMAQATMQFLALPPEVLEQMRADDPDLFDQLSRVVKRTRGATNGEIQEPAQVGNTESAAGPGPYAQPPGSPA